GNGLNWVQIATLRVTAAPNRRLTCFRTMGAMPSTGAITFDFGGQQQSVCAWSVFEYDNVDTTGTEGAGAVVQAKESSVSGSALSISLDPLADAVNSTVVGGLVRDGSQPVVPGEGCAEIDQQAVNVGGLQTQDRIGSGSTINWSWSGSNHAAAIALEIKTAIVVVAPPVDASLP